MSTQLAVVQRSAALSPLTVEEASHRYNAMVEFTKTVMVKDQDYGIIPGVSKPCLYKAGAEKLCTFFGMVPMFQLIDRVEDWTGKDHGGEMFFYYFYKCVLVRGDAAVGEGDGSCNSFEKKYRYREGKRKCPECGAEAIIVGKREYGGGFLCFAKKGGCGVKFRDGDPAIVKQDVGVTPNPEIAEQVNTIQKMAQKRALIAATLIACNASAFFTQDMEDIRSIEVEYEVMPEPTGSAEAQTNVARERIAALGGNPEVVQPKAPKVKKSKLDEPKRDIPKPDAEKLRLITAFQDMKKALHAYDTTDATYYGLLEAHGAKHCDEFDTETARLVFRKLKDALLSLKTSAANRAEIQDIRDAIGHEVFWKALEPLGITDDDTLDATANDGLLRILDVIRAIPYTKPEPQPALGITDDDVPLGIGGPRLTEWYQAVAKCREQLVSSHRAGGRFNELLGLEGYERIEDVPNMEAAHRVIAACELWAKDNPPTNKPVVMAPKGVA